MLHSSIFSVKVSNFQKQTDHQMHIDMLLNVWNLYTNTLWIYDEKNLLWDGSTFRKYNLAWHFTVQFVMESWSVPKMMFLCWSWICRITPSLFKVPNFQKHTGRQTHLHVREYMKFVIDYIGYATRRMFYGMILKWNFVPESKLSRYFKHVKVKVLNFKIIKRRLFENMEKM